MLPNNNHIIMQKYKAKNNSTLFSMSYNILFCRILPIVIIDWEHIAFEYLNQLHLPIYFLFWKRGIQWYSTECFVLTLSSKVLPLWNMFCLIGIREHFLSSQITLDFSLVKGVGYLFLGRFHMEYMYLLLRNAQSVQ